MKQYSKVTNFPTLELISFSSVIKRSIKERGNLLVNDTEIGDKGSRVRSRLQLIFDKETVFSAAAINKSERF